ncbi:MAG: hypothetical protein O2854_09565, partial [Chloroflexi bacterium]|nr:hypothetical protein [Chloroflexota bacterium]
GSVMFENAADVMVRFRSEKQTNKLGTLMEITKGNDLPDDQKRPLCLEYDFDEWGVRGIRHGNLADFPTLTLKDNMPLADQILHYLRDEAGRDSATSIARTLNAERAYVAQILTKDSRFSRVGKAGKEVFYAVTANVSPEES